MKKVLKILLILFGVMFLLLVAGVGVGAYAIKSYFTPERIGALVQEQAHQYVQRDVQLKSASLSLYPNLGIEVKGLRISNTYRKNVLQESTTLWKHLKKHNLKKLYVKVKLNGKELEQAYKKDVDLKKGDTLEIERIGFRNKVPMLELGRLFISVELMPLTRSKVVIQKVSLEKLRVLVEVDRRGSFNFDDLLGSSDKKKKTEKPKEKKKPKKSDAPAEPIGLNLAAFEIKDSRIVYNDRKGQQEIILDGINQKLSAGLDSSVTDVVSKGLFEIKSMTVRGKGMPVRKSGVYFSIKHKLHVNLKKSQLRIDQLTIGFQKTYLTLTGSVGGYDKPVRSLNLNLRTNRLKLHEVFAEVPPAMFPQAKKMKVKGDAAFGVKVKGTMDSRKKGQLPSVTGFFRINNGYFQYASLPKAINKMNIDIDFTQDSLNMKKMTFHLGSNPVSMLAKVKQFKQPIIDLFQLKADIDLSSLKDVIKLSKGMSLKGKVKADINAKGKVDMKNLDAISVKGKIALDKLVVTTSAVKKPVQLDGTFKLSNEEITLEELESTIGQSSFTMDMTIKDYLAMVLPKKKQTRPTTVTFKMNAPLLDLNEMLGLKSSSGKSSKSGKSSSKSSSGSKGSSSTGDEPISVPKLPNVVVDGKIRVKKLQYKNLPFKKSSIDLGVKNQKITMVMVSNLFNGKIEEKAYVDLSNRRQLRVKNEFNAIRVEANDLISNFNDIPKPNAGLFDQIKSMDNVVYGRMDLRTKVSTSGITSNQLKNRLSGTISTKLYRGQIKNASIFGQLTKTVPKLLQKFMPKLNNIKTRKIIKALMTIKDGKLNISNMNIPAQKFALAGYGYIKLDTKANMKLDLALSRSISRRIIRQQKRLMRAAGGAINKIGGKYAGLIKGGLGKLTSKALIPTDKKGRIIPIFGAVGPVSKMQFKFLGFKGQSTADTDKGSGGSGDLVKQGKKMLKQQVDRAKKAAMAAANAAKKKALAAANAAKKKAEAAAKKAADQAKKKAEAAAKAAKARAAKAAAKAKAAAEKKKKELEDKAKGLMKKW